jgi:uncharacterized protein
MIKRQAIIKETKEFVKSLLGSDTSGHDYWHTQRVCRQATRINKIEGGNNFIVTMGALLHDVCDWKVKKALTLEELKKYLQKQKIDTRQIERILFIVKYTSFSSKQPNKKSLELKIVQDADRLDALGAIGIARTFAYGGKTNRPIYDPKIKPELKINKKDYRQRTAPSINHFYEKLLKLKDLMNTKTGRKIAESRHKFLQAYLKQFFKEWGDGK